MRLRVALVSETSQQFLNQTKLCLYSLRKNAGSLSKTPVTLITVSEALSYSEQKFFEKHFSPIEFKVAPRLGAIAHTSKLNIFYSLDPEVYDLLLYLDCDTVIRKPLDQIAEPVIHDNIEFLCRRGGVTDRNRFVDFNKLVLDFCGNSNNSKVAYQETQEWPMFNTGVFLATSEAIKKIRKDAIEFTYLLYNNWQRADAFETLPLLQYFYHLKLLTSRKKILESWPIEQGALALSCIKAGIKVGYLDEKYNSWGNIDFSILHCFKSAYKFNRRTMYSKDSEVWLDKYSASDFTGKVFLADIIRQLKKDLGPFD